MQKFYERIIKTYPGLCNNTTEHPVDEHINRLGQNGIGQDYNKPFNKHGILEDGELIYEVNKIHALKHL